MTQNEDPTWRGYSVVPVPPAMPLYPLQHCQWRWWPVLNDELTKLTLVVPDQSALTLQLVRLLVKKSFGIIKKSHMHTKRPLPQLASRMIKPI